MKFPVSLARSIALATLLLLLSSIARHILFQSNALDLGWFDQGTYLISRGKNPIVSFVGYHILGDHAAFIFYPIALFYKIYPSVYWLFLIQALSLSIGAFPLWQLSVQAGLKERQALAVSIVYLLYPLVFNVNLFDFHPEVIAVPAILWAVLAARSNRFWLFCLALLVIVSCKAILSLTVAGMGFWLFVFEKKRKCGSIALISGTIWFIVTAKILIPLLTGKDAAAEMADSRYSYLGESLGEIIRNLFLSPDRVFSHLFTGANLEYLILLFIPVIPFLSPRTLAPLTAAIPALALNLLADHFPQKNITTQYSLPILPFLFLAVIATLANGGGWLRKPKWMILWATIAFVALAKYGYFWSRYLTTLDTWQATRQAVAAVKTNGAVLTTASIAPHLTQREDIQLAIEGSEKLDLSRFEYIILDRRHPGWSSSPERIDFWLDRVRDDRNFKLVFERDDVFFYKSVTKNDETE
ncbi:DUF2079 domain-containing protein [Pannus brasiliensis CCIBt3594]|uniref:DUF2079 domain-containing protein n=1 Tax=Pannus brasiliensis CCIBt3594 TaxID=1427578 RepID=A0AAW9QP12_9CHRO